MTVRAVIYDFDHTLVDSPLDFPAMRRGVYALLDERRLAVPDRDHKLVLEVVAEAAATLADGPAAQLRAAAEAHILGVELAAAAQAVVIPGVAESLRRLRADGRLVGVITRNCRQVVETVLERVPLELDALLTRDDVPRPKPDPGHALAALALLGVAADQALLVGDFRADIECAVRAGIRPVGVLTGSSDEAALRAAGAPDVLPSAADLPRWLAARGW